MRVFDLFEDDKQKDEPPKEKKSKEPTFGSNPDDFDDGKFKYIAASKAFAMVSKQSDKFYLVLIIYFDGRCIMTSTSNPNILNTLKASLPRLLMPTSINKALPHWEIMFEMFKAIMDKRYMRINALKFMSVGPTDLVKLERYLKRADIKAYINRRKYKYVEHVKDDSYLYITYEKR